MHSTVIYCRANLRQKERRVVTNRPRPGRPEIPRTAPTAALPASRPGYRSQPQQPSGYGMTSRHWRRDPQRTRGVANTTPQSNSRPENVQHRDFSEISGSYRHR